MDLTTACKILNRNLSDPAAKSLSDQLIAWNRSPGPRDYDELADKAIAYARYLLDEECLTSLLRDYPEIAWSASIHRGDDDITVTFQRFTDDAEDRYVIRDGFSTLI